MDKNMKNEESQIYRIQKFNIIEWISILTAIFASFGVLYSEIKGLDSKMESRTLELRAELTQQCSRTDKLYQMFYELIKETRK